MKFNDDAWYREFCLSEPNDHQIIINREMWRKTERFAVEKRFPWWKISHRRVCECASTVHYYCSTKKKRNPCGACVCVVCRKMCLNSISFAVDEEIRKITILWMRKHRDWSFSLLGVHTVHSRKIGSHSVIHNWVWGLSESSTSNVRTVSWTMFSERWKNSNLKTNKEIRKCQWYQQFLVVGRNGCSENCPHAKKKVLRVKGDGGGKHNIEIENR